MKLDRKELKKTAKEAMRAARPSPYWVSLAMVAVMLALGVLSMSLDGSLTALRSMYAAALDGQMTYVEPRAVGGGMGWLLGVALEVMSLELTVGFVIYAVRVWRREKAGCGDLFDGFGVFFRSIWIQLLPSLLISLWSMVYVLPVTVLVTMTGQTWWLVIGLPLLIPTVMAALSYRLAVYIMLDNRNLSCWQCITLSREMMRGHRWESFVLDLSFLGWALLCAIPVAGFLLMIWITAYQQVVVAGYYDRLMTEFMRRNAPPVEPIPPTV